MFPFRRQSLTRTFSTRQCFTPDIVNIPQNEMLIAKTPKLPHQYLHSFAREGEGEKGGGLTSVLLDQYEDHTQT